MRLRFTVPGPPVPKARARVVRDKNTGNTHSFTPSKTEKYEEHVRLHALQARLKVPGPWPWQDDRTRFGIAISVYRSAERGDLDNYEKAIWDACNQTLWKDDRQIRRRGEGGIYECAKGQERVEVEVWTL